jgi:hypothetical protein
VLGNGPHLELQSERPPFCLRFLEQQWIVIWVDLTQKVSCLFEEPSHLEDTAGILGNIDVPFVVKRDAFLVLTRKRTGVPYLAGQAEFEKNCWSRR